MDNQHRQIKGYRELSEADIALMNKIKEFGGDIQHLLFAVNSHVTAQRRAASELAFKAEGMKGWTEGRTLQEAADEEEARLNAAQPDRWSNIARTHFQEGLMALTRAVAQPTFF